MNRFLFFFITLTLSQHSLAEAFRYKPSHKPIFKCVRKNVLRFENPRNVQLNPMSFIVRNEHELVVDLPEKETLTFDTQKNQYFITTLEGKFLIQKQDNGNFVYSPSQTKTGRKKAVRLLSSHAKKVVLALQEAKLDPLRSQINNCAKMKSFSEQLKAPMLPIEVSTCKEQLDLLNKIHYCNDSDSCQKAAQNITRHDLIGKTSFVKLFESKFALSDPAKRVGQVLAADTVVSYSIQGTLMATPQATARIAAKVGMRYAGFVSAYFALTALTKPILLAVFNFDDCGEKGFHSTNERNWSDCINQSANKIRNKLGDTVSNGVANPSQFIKDVSSRSDGRPGRITCYVFESMINDWKLKIENTNRYQCEGNMISFANGRRFHIEDGNTLVEYPSANQRYVFKPEGVSIRDLTDNSESPAIPRSQMQQHLESLPRNDPRRNQAPNSLMDDYRFIEHKLMQPFFPKLKAMVEAGGPSRCVPEAQSTDSSSQPSEIHR